MGVEGVHVLRAARLRRVPPLGPGQRRVCRLPLRAVRRQPESAGLHRRGIREVLRDDGRVGIDGGGVGSGRGGVEEEEGWRGGGRGQDEGKACRGGFCRRGRQQLIQEFDGHGQAIVVVVVVVVVVDIDTATAPDHPQQGTAMDEVRNRRPARAGPILRLAMAGDRRSVALAIRQLAREQPARGGGPATSLLRGGERADTKEGGGDRGARGRQAFGGRGGCSARRRSGRRWRRPGRGGRCRNDRFRRRGERING